MYQRKSDRKIHKKYTVEEKIQIALLYIDQHMSQSEIIRTYDLANSNVLYRWVKQYREQGTISETRGKATKFTSPKKGRPNKLPERTLEEYSKEELIERCKMLEDIKKSFAYLENQKQKKNIK